MTDTQALLRRLAEREGGYYRNGSAGPASVLPVEWNPLTNDADAFALIEKYQLHVDWYNGQWQIEYFSSRGAEAGWQIEAEGYDADLKRAICLAICAMGDAIGGEG